MGPGNKHPYPFLIVAGTLGCLILLSFVQTSFSFSGLTFRKVDVLAELRHAETPKNNAHHPSKKSLATKVQIPGDHPEDTPVDSIDTDGDQQQPGDNGSFPTPEDYTVHNGIIEYYVPGNPTNGLTHFISALHGLQSGNRKKVRIAYFGDSMIEGDLITQDLRDSLQTFFGGSGVGFVPMMSITASFRTSITQTASKDWTDLHFKSDNSKDGMIGVSGHTFTPTPQSWAKYAPVKRRHLDNFEEVSLLYAAPKPAAEVQVENTTVALTGNEPVNMLPLPVSGNAPFTLKFGNARSSVFYGVSIEGKEGVVLDNFSFRGISGIELGKLKSNMLKSLQAERPYDLIVLHYGANVLWKPDLTDYSWFERPMKKVIDSLHHIFPNTSFLIIGTADKAYKKDGEYVTAPGVQALLDVQNNIAEENGFAFYNLFRAMGGEGSMVNWVEGETVLANKDYTHFNARGASKIAGLLYKAIMNEFKMAEKH